MNELKKTGWLNRNWKWVVPLGCFSFLVLFAGFVVLLMHFVFSLMKSSEPYKVAVETARGNQQVQQSLGTPIEEGFFASGNISVNGPSGYAELAIPVSGPLGEATIYVQGEKAAGKWAYSDLFVEVEGSGATIDLLGQAGSPPQIE